MGQDIYTYMIITKDKYQFPVKIFDSLQEMSECLGISKDYIQSYTYKAQHGKIKKPKYMRVRIDDE